MDGLRIVLPGARGIRVGPRRRATAVSSRACKGGALRKRLADFGGEPGGGTPEEFGQFIAAETVRYADIVKLSGAKME